MFFWLTTATTGLSSVVRNMAGPSNPHRRLPTSALAERGIADEAKLQAGKGEEAQGLMPDGAVIIAAITSCTNTSNPRNVIAAGLLARNATRLGLTRKPWVKTSLAPGSQVVTEYLEASGLQKDLNKIGFNLVGYGCTTCIGNSGPLDADIEGAIKNGDLVTASVLSGNRNFEARVHQSIKANFLMSPPLVVAFALAGEVVTGMLDRAVRGLELVVEDEVGVRADLPVLAQHEQGRVEVEFLKRAVAVTGGGVLRPSTGLQRMTWSPGESPPTVAPLSFQSSSPSPKKRQRAGAMPSVRSCGLRKTASVGGP